MKTTAITLLTVFAVSLIAYVAISTAPHIPTYRASYLLDRTDTFELDPVVVRPAPQLSHDALKQEREIRVRRVTNIVNEDVTVLSIPVYRDLRDLTSFDFEDNEVFRRKRIQKVDEQLSRVLADLGSQQTGFSHSAILEPLVQELAHLQEHTGDDRELFMYSDLGENTPASDWILDKATLAQLASGDPAPWEDIEGVRGLTDLTGININIIHRPKAVHEDVAFGLRARYLKARLSELGATVHIHGGIHHNPTSHE